MTCSEVLRVRAISGLVRPCQTSVVTLISRCVNCSRGDIIHLLLFKDGGCKNHTFAALLDSCAQKQSAQVLLNGTWADLQFNGDVLVTAPLDRQLQHLLSAAGDFDLLQIDHVSLRTRR